MWIFIPAGLFLCCQQSTVSLKSSLNLVLFVLWTSEVSKKSQSVFCIKASIEKEEKKKKILWFTLSRSCNRKEASQGMKIGTRSQREEGSNIFPLTCGQIPAELFLLSIPGSATVLSADSQWFRSESEQSTEDKSHLWCTGYAGAWRTYSPFKKHNCMW